MTVCFRYDPQDSPYVVKYDKFDTLGNRGADGKISTYDVYDAWPNRKNADKSEDRELCYAFEAAVLKRWFYDNTIQPIAQTSQRWTYWMALPALITDIDAKRNEAVGAINAVGQWGWMDESYDRSPVFTSAKEFVSCASRELTSSIKSGSVSAAAIVNQCGSLEL